jgi:hypothetical protein
MKVGDKIRITRIETNVVATVRAVGRDGSVKVTVDDDQHELHPAQGGPQELYVAADNYEAV